jgi:hypothetical protein
MPVTAANALSPALAHARRMHEDLLPRVTVRVPECRSHRSAVPSQATGLQIIAHKRVVTMVLAIPAYSIPGTPSSILPDSLTRPPPATVTRLHIIHPCILPRRASPPCGCTSHCLASTTMFRCFATLSLRRPPP